MSGKINQKDIEKSTSQVKDAQQRADRVASTMSQNITDMKKQGEQLGKLQEKTATLQETSSQFRSTARKAKSKAFWNNMKWMLILLLVLVGIAVFVGYKMVKMRSAN